MYKRTSKNGHPISKPLTKAEFDSHRWAKGDKVREDFNYRIGRVIEVDFGIRSVMADFGGAVLNEYKHDELCEIIPAKKKGTVKK